MKLLLYIALLLGIALFPVNGSDVGKLIPVEVIAVYEENGMITVKTDTGDAGYGTTFDEAFRDMKDTAPGVIYLDTAEYLILEETIQNRVAELCPYLKEGIQVYGGEEGMPIEGLASYLAVHGECVRMREAVNGTQIPVLREENGRYHVTVK